MKTPLVDAFLIEVTDFDLAGGHFENGTENWCQQKMFFLKKSAMQQGLEKPQRLYIIRLVGLEGLYGVSFPP